MTLFRVFPCFFREMCVWFWSVRAVFVPVRSLYGSFHSLSSHHACLSPAVELPSPESCQVIRIISPRDNLNVTFFGPLRASNLSHRFCIVLRKFWWFPKMQLSCVMLRNILSLRQGLFFGASLQDCSWAHRDWVNRMLCTTYLTTLSLSCKVVDSLKYLNTSQRTLKEPKLIKRKVGVGGK